MLLFEVGQRDDGAVRGDHQFVVVGVLDDGDMGQGHIGRAETALLVEDGTHVLVGGQQALHQDVGFAGVDEVASHGSGFHVNGLVDDAEVGHVNAFGLAHFGDHFLVTEKGGFDKTFFHGSIHCTDGVVVVSIGSHKAFLGFAAQNLEHLL